MASNTYHVLGMTCGHCVKAVTEELTAIDGIGHVQVDLDTGLVTVESASPVDLALIEAAVDEAGYVLAAS